MSSFSQLKRDSSSGAGLARLADEINKVQGASFGPDERIWKPTTDKVGNGSALIRFLPPCQGETAAFIKIFSHAFKGVGGWYIENCLTTLKQEDPCALYNTMLWNTGLEENKQIVQGAGKDKPGSKRKQNYFSNILVIEDPAKPENNGKVFLYKYGKKIFDMLNDAQFPQFGEDPFDPFDFWKGANFRLRIRSEKGYPNYDKSTFEACGPLSEVDDEMEAIWKTQYSLDTYYKEAFKPFETLEKRLNLVIGAGNTRVAAVNRTAEDNAPSFGSSAPAKTKASAPKAKPVMDDGDGDDDYLAQLQGLVDADD